MAFTDQSSNMSSIEKCISAHVERDHNIYETPHASGDALLIDENGQIRKLPIPSADPNDPLNYSKWAKVGITVSCCWFSIMSLALSGGLGAILDVFFEIYIPQGHTPTQVVWLLTFPSLFIGVGNFIILPLALVFGRRPVFLTSAICLLFATIGAALSTSFNGHLAARIMQGLSTGATESLLPLMLTEISFIDERSMMFGFYWTTQSALSSALNLASSYETASLSWRWFYWVYVFAISFGLILAFFCAFETRFRRPPMAFDGQMVMTDDYGVTHIVQGAVEGQSNEPIPSKKSYLQVIKPWSGITGGLNTIVTCWAHMIGSFTSPGIVYALILSSICLGCSIAVSLTYDTVLQGYGWQPASIGLINIGGIIGAFLGMLYAGWPADRLTVFMARRNGGVHKPEHRLIMLVFPGVIAVASLLLYGFTAEGSTWWGPYIGWTMNQFVFCCILIISTTFAAETWPQNPGPAIVAVVGAKNIVSFGLTYGITPMLARFGYITSMGILAGICGGVFVLGVPVYFWNPKWRAFIARRESKEF